MSTISLTRSGSMDFAVVPLLDQVFQLLGLVVSGGLDVARTNSTKNTNISRPTTKKTQRAEPKKMAQQRYNRGIHRGSLCVNERVVTQSCQGQKLEPMLYGLNRVHHALLFVTITSWSPRTTRGYRVSFVVTTFCAQRSRCIQALKPPRPALQNQISPTGERKLSSQLHSLSRETAVREALRCLHFCRVITSSALYPLWKGRNASLQRQTDCDPIRMDFERLKGSPDRMPNGWETQLMNTSVCELGSKRFGC